MLFSALKILISSCVIAFTSWLAGKRPDLAGFIIALPVATMLVLPFSYIEHNDPQASVQFAKSIFVAVPLSLFFFVPFLFADRLSLPFWGLYCSGAGCLVIAYFVHRWIMSFF